MRGGEDTGVLPTGDKEEEALSPNTPNLILNPTFITIPTPILMQIHPTFPAAPAWTPRGGGHTKGLGSSSHASLDLQAGRPPGPGQMSGCCGALPMGMSWQGFRVEPTWTRMGREKLSSGHPPSRETPSSSLPRVSSL